MLREPDIAQRLIGQGVLPIGDSQAQFARTIESDVKQYGELVRTAGIRAE